MDNKTLTIVSTDKIITTVQLMRDSRVNELLHDEQRFAEFLEKHCDVIAISPIRKEFLRKDLVALKASRLDLVHYAVLLQESKVSGIVKPEAMDALFILEFQLLFDKYKF